MHDCQPVSKPIWLINQRQRVQHAGPSTRQLYMRHPQAWHVYRKLRNVSEPHEPFECEYVLDFAIPNL